MAFSYPVGADTRRRSTWRAQTQKGGTTELSRSQFRSQPAFQLRTSLDDSVLYEDGTLIRSARLARLEATLLISGQAVSARKLVQLARLINVKEVHELIDRLNTSYDRSCSAFRIERMAAGFQMMTRPALAGWLDRLHQRQTRMKLSQPAMETLTIIAYRQPITRADVEAIRGVQSSEMIRQLIDRGLVRVGGEDDSLGRPFLYVTTGAFLDMFGLGRVQEMPAYDSLGRVIEAEESIADDVSEEFVADGNSAEPDADDAPELAA